MLTSALSVFSSSVFSKLSTSVFFLAAGFQPNFGLCPRFFFPPLLNRKSLFFASPCQSLQLFSRATISSLFPVCSSRFFSFVQLNSSSPPRFSPFLDPRLAISSFGAPHLPRLSFFKFFPPYLPRPRFSLGFSLRLQFFFCFHWFTFRSKALFSRVCLRPP